MKGLQNIIKKSKKTTHGEEEERESPNLDYWGPNTILLSNCACFVAWRDDFSSQTLRTSPSYRLECWNS